MGTFGEIRELERQIRELEKQLAEKKLYIQTLEMGSMTGYTDVYITRYSIPATVDVYAELRRAEERYPYNCVRATDNPWKGCVDAEAIYI